MWRERQRQREDCQKRHCLQYIPPDSRLRWIPGCEGRVDHSMRESDTICFVCIVCVSIPWSSPMPSSSSSSSLTPESKHRREKSDNDDERGFRATEEEREKRQLECSWCRLWMIERKKRLQSGRSSLFNLSLSLAHRIAGGSIFFWTLFLSVCVERAFLLLHRLVFSADLVLLCSWRMQQRRLVAKS